MATKIYFRRGTRAEIEAVVPENGEPIWATDEKTFYIGDDTTSGGIFVAGGSAGVSTLNDLMGNITISGAGNVIITEDGQVIVVSGVDVVNALNSLFGNVTISGAGIVEVTEDGQIIVISGQNLVDVDSINDLTGEVTVSGTGGIEVTEQGQVIVISGGTSDVQTFLDLTDTPEDYSGQAGKVAAVKDTEDGLEFVTQSGGAGSGDFLGLSDTPATYSGMSGKYTKVNQAEDSLEFARVLHLEALTEDHSWTGLTCDGVAGENLTIGEAVYCKSDSKYWESDADSTSTMPCAGLATGTISADASGIFLVYGFMRDDSWSWSGGGLIYASCTAGELTQTIPSGSGDQVQVVGLAKTSQIVHFNPGYGLVEIA